MNKGRDRGAQDHDKMSDRDFSYCLPATPSPLLQSRSVETKGEYVLANAVLREAIREYQKFARYQSRRGMKLFGEVDQWFSVDDRDSCFSFLNVCQILDLEPTYIRIGLHMWRERVSKHNA